MVRLKERIEDNDLTGEVNFNSKVVRLKAGIRQRNGSPPNEFQFQSGAVKSNNMSFRKLNFSNFNSKVVRLKVQRRRNERKGK